MGKSSGSHVTHVLNPSAEMVRDAQQTSSSAAAMFHRGWKEADATVIVARDYVSTAENIAGLDSSSDVVVEVHPEGDDAFRAEAHISYSVSTSSNIA